MKTRNLKILFRIFFFLLFSNCYFNPLVQPIVNPEVTEKTNPFLALLGLSGESNLLITGQILDPNGVTLEGLFLVPSPTLIQAKSTLPPYATDAGGRFYIPYQTGSFTFEVIRDGLSFFILTLNVSSPNQITATTASAPPGLEIINLGTINGNDAFNFFELVKVFYLDGEMNEVSLHNATVTNYFNQFVFRFSEAPMPALPTGPLVTSWISQNITTSPPISFDNFMNVSENTLTIAPLTIPGMTVYEITLKPGIFSATGKPLTERTIRFDYQYNP